jgi:hypothetical protein
MFSARSIKASPASSWICWRGTPVAKPKSKPSSVSVGKPATRANISRARTRRASRSARRDLFEKVSKRGRLGGAAFSDYGIEIWNGAEPQFPGQLGQALMLQIAHGAPPAKAS